MDREKAIRITQKIKSAADRVSITAWQSEHDLDSFNFFGRDLFGTDRKAREEAARLIAEIDDLVTLRDELKASF